jgi:hypothetical protein
MIIMALKYCAPKSGITAIEIVPDLVNLPPRRLTFDNRYSSVTWNSYACYHLSDSPEYSSSVRRRSGFHHLLRAWMCFGQLPPHLRSRLRKGRL